jgi:hypothetical protein
MRLGCPGLGFTEIFPRIGKIPVCLNFCPPLVILICIGIKILGSFIRPCFRIEQRCCL